MALTYTTIQHGFRKANELSLLEYTLCDMIYFLSTQPKSASPGWCYMSKQVMALELGITKRGVLKLLERLEENGFVDKNADTKFLKTTEKWNQVYGFAGGEQSSPMVNKVRTGGEQSSPTGGEQSSPNNIYTNNNKIKNGDEAPIYESLIGKSFELFSEAGISGVYFLKMKNLYGISDVEVNRLFQAWKKEHEATGTIFKTPEHLKNSFNKFIKNSRRGGKQEPEAVPQRVKGGTLI